MCVCKYVCIYVLVGGWQKAWRNPSDWSWPSDTEDGSQFCRTQRQQCHSRQEAAGGSQPTINFSAKLLWVFGVQS